MARPAVTDQTVLELIQRSDRPLTVNDLAAMVPDKSKQQIHRSVAALTKAHKIKRLDETAPGGAYQFVATGQRIEQPRGPVWKQETGHAANGIDLGVQLRVTGMRLLPGGEKVVHVADDAGHEWDLIEAG